MNNNNNPISADELEDIKMLLDLQCKEHIVEKVIDENNVNQQNLILLNSISKTSAMKK